MGDTGLEHNAITPSKTPIQQNSGAKSGALNDEIEDDLAEIIAAWPRLSIDVRQEIKALAGVREGKTKK